MTIAPGTFLGSYEILAPLGAGGMGEVFRARDTRIGREVAIKVLPAAMTCDAGRLRRFEQEARAAGALNHPNLVTIHEFGSHGEAPFIVMELLEGQTLRDLVRSTDDGTGSPRLSIRKVIDYATQIATGLAAAHEKGIVHRDLKPENIFVTSDGRVKILDFGLAKLSGPADVDGTEARTEKKNTSPGTVMGTAGYMSPEQVRGQPVDHRTDIFSFGSILYEMLSGRRAFRGDSAADTMSAILLEDPPELTGTRPNAPPALDRIARHCLEKNPSQRFQSAQDLAFDIAACSLEPSTGERFVIGRRRPRPSFLAAGLGLLLAGALGVIAGHRSSKAAEPLSFHQITFRRGNILHARFAPDGQTIYYSAAFEGTPGQVYSSRADASETHALGIAGDVVAVSPKGELGLMIKKALEYEPGGIATVATIPVSGGTPRELLTDALYADWSPDGSEFAAVRFGTKDRLILEWPVGHQIASLSSVWGDIRFSPDGRQIAFSENDADALFVRVVNRSGRETAKIGPFPLGSCSGLAWTRDNKAIILSTPSSHGDTAILRCGLKSDCATLFREPNQITVHDMAGDGRLLIEESIPRETLQILAGRTGIERDLPYGSAVAGISAAGDALAIWQSGITSAQTGIFYRKTDGTPPVRLGDGFPVALSSDGKWVLAVDSQGGSKLRVVPTGPGLSRSFAPPWSEVLTAGFLSSSGAIVVALDPAHVPRTYRLDLETGRITSVAASLTGVQKAVVSPDGKKFAAFTPQGTYIVDVAGAAPTRKLELTLKDEPIAWSNDGRELYISPQDESPRSIYLFDAVTGQRTLVRRLVLPADPSGIMGSDSLFMTSDAQTIVYKTTRVASSILFVVESK
jgi:serine/threonine protein kinase/WD40 repeat protein